MKTRLAALASAVLLGVFAGASGCADNRASIQTQAICFPTDNCTFSETCEAQYIGYPTLDKSVSTSLWLFLQVANQLPNNEDVSIGRLNTNDAHIDETSIEYEGALAGTQLVGSNYRVPAEGTAVVSVRMGLSGAVAGTAAAPTEVLARVRFRGYLDDGTRFETGDFPVSVKVCTGCAPAICAAPDDACPQEGQRPVACAAAP
jgi:hypothetical protein